MNHHNQSSSVVGIDNASPLVLFAGLNVLESVEIASEVVTVLKRATDTLGMPFVFKASFDKANRSDHRSYRGPGLQEGLKQLSELKRIHNVKIVTDVHEQAQIAPVAEVVDVIQIPAFLARQTDLLAAAAQTGKPLLIKKMQMMSPQDGIQLRRKALALGASSVMICDRGTMFGYQNLVLDFQGLCELKRAEIPLVVDVSHGLQRPGSEGTSTGGRGVDLIPMARALVGLGIGGLFLECHPKPSEARCDGPCALELSKVESLLFQLSELDALVKSVD